VAAAACRPAPPRPNVLIVTIDTLRADRVGCYGFGLARTPTIDGLAHEGVRCTDAASVAPITMPSHTSIMTGLYPPAHGVRDNGAYALGDGVTTLAERLKAAGYETHAFVSAAVLDHVYNLVQGFDTYDDDLSAEDSPPLFMIRDRPGPRTADRVLGWLDQWLGQTSRRPFFTWVHFYDPHQPYEAKGNDLYLLPTPYDREIAVADRSLGRIIDRLRTAGVLDDTIVVLTADHGESLDEHGEKTHGLFIYDATIHVPLVWRYPRALPSGSTYGDPVRSVDIVPTLLTLLDLPGADETQGTSLAAAFQGRERKPDLPQYSESLLAELGFGMAPLQSIRRHGTKYIRAPRPELYDLHADPHELKNVFAKDDERARALMKDLDDVLADSRARAVPATANPMNRETMEMLQALGYLTPPTDRESMAGIDPKDGLVAYEKLERARHHAQRDDWAGAKQLLQEIIADNPRHVTAYNILALAAIRLGAPKEAEQAYEKSLAIDPAQHRVHAMLGQLALDREALDDAEGHYRQALALVPTFSEGIAYLGYIQARRGDPNGAETWWARGTKLDPDFPLMFRRIADEYYTRGDHRAALVYYDRLLAASPQHFGALIQASNSARELGEIDRARRYLERAQTARPDSWIPPYNLACLEGSQNRPEEAVALLRQALKGGFERPALLEESDDFASVRRLADYPQLLADARENAARENAARDNATHTKRQNHEHAQ
jgi:arylsulfatase A-like enzyme/Tfp pilus assembly protein PilF